MMNAIDPERLGLALRTTRVGRSLEAHTIVDSTMDLAQTAAARGAPDGHLVWADAQRSGRGTRGRTWSSPPDTDLYFSVVLRPGLPLTDLPPITLAAGVAVCDVIAEALGEPDRVRIKWPNDVWIDRRKGSGILVESVGSGAIADAVIVGIGVNVNRRELPAELGETATSVWLARGDATADPIDRAQLLADLLGSLEQWVDRLLEHGPAAIVETLRSRLALVDAPAQLDGQEGTVRGVDEHGALLFETKAGLISVRSGRLLPLPRSESHR